MASKFDNRLKEFAERWEVDKYLSATGYLPPHVKPFFVALPKDRSIQTSSEWRKAMQVGAACEWSVLLSVIKGRCFCAEHGASQKGFSPGSCHLGGDRQRLGWSL